MNITISDVAVHISRWNIPFSYYVPEKASETELAARAMVPHTLAILERMTEEEQRFMLGIYDKDSWFGQHEIATQGYHVIFIEEYCGRYEYVGGEQVYDNWKHTSVGARGIS